MSLTENQLGSFVTQADLNGIVGQIFEKVEAFGAKLMEQMMVEVRAQKGADTGEGSFVHQENSRVSESSQDLMSTPNVKKRRKNDELIKQDEENEEEPLPTKSLALIYYEQEAARNKRWMTSNADQFTKELQNGKRFISIFAGNLPDLHDMILLFGDNQEYVMNTSDFANFRSLENSIYLPELPPLPKGAPKRQKREVTANRRKWLETLRTISFPFFNENRPKTTGGSRLEYADRVYLVAQWVHTHLFWDREYLLHSVYAPGGGNLIREYKLKLKMTAIVSDIKSVQKNRGDSDTKYLNTLVEKDESMEVEVPEQVLHATRKKSPKKNVGLMREESDVLSCEASEVSDLLTSDGKEVSSVEASEVSDLLTSDGKEVSSVEQTSSINEGASGVRVTAAAAGVESFAPLPLPRNKIKGKITTSPALAKITIAPALAKITIAPEHRVVRRTGGGRDKKTAASPDSVVTYYNGSSSSSPIITSKTGRVV